MGLEKVLSPDASPAVGIMSRLWRIILRTTKMRQARSEETVWTEQVIYCGYDVAEALRVHADSKQHDIWHEYGGVCRETISSNPIEGAYQEWGQVYKCRGCHEVCPHGLAPGQPAPVIQHKRRKKRKGKAAT